MTNDDYTDFARLYQNAALDLPGSRALKAAFYAREAVRIGLAMDDADDLVRTLARIAGRFAL